MPYNRIQAGRLLTAGELAVFEASLADTLATLPAARLPALIRRARTMRDKAQDLLRRQRLQTRARTGTKVGTSGVANERTAQKLRALDEALKRFELRLAQTEAAAERAARSAERVRAAAAAPARKAAKKAPAIPKRSAKARAEPPTPGAPSLPAASAGALDKGMLQQRKFTGAQAIQAHVGARGRRQQAKRDGKG